MVESNKKNETQRWRAATVRERRQHRSLTVAALRAVFPPRCGPVSGPGSRVVARSPDRATSPVVARSPDRATSTSCDRRSPRLCKSGDLRSGIVAGSGDPATTGRQHCSLTVAALHCCPACAARTKFDEVSLHSPHRGFTLTEYRGLFIIPAYL